MGLWGSYTVRKEGGKEVRKNISKMDSFFIQGEAVQWSPPRETTPRPDGAHRVDPLDVMDVEQTIDSIRHGERTASDIRRSERTCIPCQ